MFSNDTYSSIILIFCFLFTVVIHEFAHGYVAYLFGDDTAKKSGRLTLNPLKHLDLMGTLLIIFFQFGYAKPVPINMYNFKYKRIGLFFTAIAGVLINMITAILCLKLYKYINIEIIQEILITLGIMSVNFAVFNLLPFPPLDGSKVIDSILPEKYQNTIFKYEKYGIIILFILIYLGYISKLISPIITKIVEIIII